MTDVTTQSSAQEPSSDEKLLALLSHLSIVLGGIILPIIVWATQKDKSKFVRFHSLQAIFFHIAYVVLLVLLIIIVVFGFILTGLGTGAFKGSQASETMPVYMIVGIIIFYALLFLFIFAGIGYAIFVGIKAYKGIIYKIPFIGNVIYKKVYEQS